MTGITAVVIALVTIILAAGLRMAGTLGVTETTLSQPAILGSHPPITKKVTMAIDGTARVAGTVLGIVAADGTYAPYVDTNNDGTQTAKAILLEDVAIHAATVEAVVLIHGDVIEANLTGEDANGIADLLDAGIYVV
jgi:hypothetical protein